MLICPSSFEALPVLTLASLGKAVVWKLCCQPQKHFWVMRYLGWSPLLPEPALTWKNCCIKNTRRKVYYFWYPSPSMNYHPGSEGQFQSSSPLTTAWHVQMQLFLLGRCSDLTHYLIIAGCSVVHLATNLCFWFSLRVIIRKYKG